MGRTYTTAKTVANHLLNIDINWLQREGLLKPASIVRTIITWAKDGEEAKGSVGLTINTRRPEPYVEMDYVRNNTWSSDEKDMCYRVGLTRTPCYFGGYRWWFVCWITANDKFCGHQVGKLYMAGDYFACRHCYDLTYRSRNISRRSSAHAACRYLDASDEIERLERQIRHRFYAGKPTKAQGKIDRLRRQLTPLSTSLYSN